MQIFERIYLKENKICIIPKKLHHILVSYARENYINVTFKISILHVKLCTIPCNRISDSTHEDHKNLGENDVAAQNCFF